MKTIKALLFDLGGVVGTNAPRLFINEFTVKHDMPADEVVSAFKRSFPAWLQGEISEGDFWKDFYNGLNLAIPEDEFIKDCKEQIRLFAVTDDQVLEVIKQAKAVDEELKTALASNCPKELGNYLEEHYALGELFDVIQFSGGIGVAKPENAFYERVLEAVGVAAEEAVFIDDKEKNLDAAQNLGIQTIHFKELPQLKEELAQYKITLEEEA